MQIYKSEWILKWVLLRRLIGLHVSIYLTVMDGKSNSAALDTSSATLSTAPGGTVPVNIPNQVNGGNVQFVNGQNQQPIFEADGRGKKKIQLQGRGRGIGAVPKGRGSTTPGWTGAGFDVDGRS